MRRARCRRSTTCAWELCARSVQIRKRFRSRAAAEQNDQAPTEQEPIHPAFKDCAIQQRTPARAAQSCHAFLALIRDVKTER
jgi:hypothetical protein